MSTRHVILAILNVAPATGYDLAQHEAISTHPLWAAAHSQIYPALHQLSKEGLIESEDRVRGQRQRRVVYRITEAGRREFADWLTRPIQYLPFRDPFRLWSAFINQIPPEVVFRTIDEHIRRCAEKAVHLQEVADAMRRGDHPLMQARIGRVSPEELDRIELARSSAWAEVAALARFDVESAIRVRELALRLHPNYPAPPPPELPTLFD
jgi:PadR family transcriptional regulator AphA